MVENFNNNVINKTLTETFTFYESSFWLWLIRSKRLKYPFITISPNGFSLSNKSTVIPWRMVKDINISRTIFNEFINVKYTIVYTFTDEFINLSRLYIPNKKFTTKRPTYKQYVVSIKKPGNIDLFSQVFHLFWQHYK